MTMWYQFADPVLNPVLGWVLHLPPIAGIAILCVIITFVSTLLYKYTTDQTLLRQVREETKALQAQAKAQKDNPEKALETNQKMMAVSMRGMKENFKSIIWTFLPMLIIFGWLTSHFTYMAIGPGQEFGVELTANAGVNGSVTAKVPAGMSIIGSDRRAFENGIAGFTFKGDEGEHTLDFNVDGQEYQTSVLITEGRGYANPLTIFNDGPVRTITVGLKPLVVVNFFGWELGWLLPYILISIVLSQALRKVLKVY